MKKTIRLTEKELIRVVKRIVSENIGKNPKFKKIIVNNIDKLVEDGLYAEEGDNMFDDYVFFRNSETDEVVFRYSIETGRLLYSNKIDEVPHQMFGSDTWDVMPNKYEIVGKIVREWVEENLVPEFSEDVEEITGDEFYISDIYNDEDFDPFTGTIHHRYD